MVKQGVSTAAFSCVEQRAEAQGCKALLQVAVRLLLGQMHTAASDVLLCVKAF